MTTRNTPLFQAETNGYNRQQVDTVWAKLEEQYKNLYEQWKTLSEQNVALARDAAAFQSTHEQLLAELENKTLENERLTQQVKVLESTGRPASFSVDPISRELMDIVLRHAAEIIADAKMEAASIAQRAQVDHAAKQSLAPSACTGFQATRVS